MAQHFFANDGSDWKSQPSPLDSKKARAEDRKLDNAGRKGEGPSAANEGRLEHTIVEGSESGQ